MKLVKSTLKLAATWALLLAPLTQLGAQTDREIKTYVPPGQQGQAAEVEKRIAESRVLEADEVAKRLGEFRKGRAGAALDEFLRKEGFKPAEGKGDYFGVDLKLRGDDGKKAGIGLLLQNYTHPNPAFRAALAAATSGSGADASTYAFLLLLREEGGLEKAVEYRADEQARVVPANSWWTCYQNTSAARCSARCSSARAACNSIRDFAGYLNCVVRSADCGLCNLGVMACCTCNCGWWCSWACGCCRH